MTSLNVKPDPKKPVKAIYAAVIAALGTLATALTDGGISPLEGVALATSVVVAFGGVYFAENPLVAVEPPEGQPVEVPAEYEPQHAAEVPFAERLQAADAEANPEA